MKIHSLITFIAASVIVFTFTACDDKLGLIPSPPPVQNISREVIIVMPPLEVKTVPDSRKSNSTLMEVSQCL